MSIWFKNAKKGSGDCETCDCQPSVCDPCAPPCPEPALKCDTRSASKSKCGFWNPDDLSTPYLQFTHCTDGKKQVDSYSVDDMGNCTLTEGTPTDDIRCCPDLYAQWDGEEYRYYSSTTFTRDSSRRSPPPTDENYVSSTRWTVHADCTAEATGTGSYSNSSGLSLTRNWSSQTWDGTDGEGNSVSYWETDWPGNIFADTEQQTYEDEVMPISAEYANPYSTAQLIAKTQAAMGEFPNTWTGSCSSSRHLAVDETYFAQEESRGKFTLDDPLDDSLTMTIHYSVRFVPDGGGAPVVTTGTTTIASGETESDVISIPVPIVDGESTLAIDSYECSSAGE